MDKEIDLAWIGGFFEGDGSITLYRTTKGAFRGRVTISQKDPGMLEFIQQTFATLGVFGNINMNEGSFKDGREYHIFELCYSSRLGVNFLNIIYPYLHSSKYKLKTKIYQEMWLPNDKQGRKTSEKRQDEREKTWNDWCNLRDFLRENC